MDTRNLESWPEKEKKTTKSMHTEFESWSDTKRNLKKCMNVRRSENWQTDEDIKKNKERKMKKKTKQNDSKWIGLIRNVWLVYTGQDWNNIIDNEYETKYRRFPGISVMKNLSFLRRILPISSNVNIYFEQQIIFFFFG